MTAHTPPPTSVRHRPSAGPAANLIELPDASRASLATAADIDSHLSKIEAARQRQLAALPAADLDVVAAAHRATVEQILQQVRAARTRLAQGAYGVCATCNTEIAPPRLKLRPYAATCTPCAQPH